MTAEIDRLREDAATGVPLSGMSAQVLEEYLSQVLQENARLRNWRVALRELVPDLAAIQDDPNKAGAYLAGTLRTQRDRIRMLFRDRDEVAALLADVPSASMPEEWRRRLRALRGGFFDLPDEGCCPACLSPVRHLHGAVRRDEGGGGPARLCEYAWHTPAGVSR